MARPEESLISGPIEWFGRVRAPSDAAPVPPVRWADAVGNHGLHQTDRLEIGEDEVHVWFAYLPPDPGAEREAWTVLTPQSGPEPTG